MKNAQNTIKFEIPDGYEFDLTKSGRKTIVCTKRQEKADMCTDGARYVHERDETATYKPKEGDLVVFTLTDIEEKEYIGIWKCDPAITPCLFSSIITSYRWSYMPDSHNVKGHIIRPATAEEAALFTRILSENGYEYDPEKKEVREKRWIAEKGEPYLYVSEWGSVEESEEYGFEEDYLRHKSRNYFRLTEREEAEAAAAKYREILRNR